MNMDDGSKKEVNSSPSKTALSLRHQRLIEIYGDVPGEFIGTTGRGQSTLRAWFEKYIDTEGICSTFLSQDNGLVGADIVRDDENRFTVEIRIKDREEKPEKV